MIAFLKKITAGLLPKLILTVGLTLLVTISAWAYFNIKNQKQRAMQNIVRGTDRLSNTILLGTHYAMMLNSRDDINQIIQNIARQKEIENIRIYNKEGEIKFTNRPPELDLRTDIKAEVCDICHRADPPLTRLDLSQRIRIFNSREGYRLLGIISPIRNDPGCSTGDCHVHPAGKKILGALDVVVSLEDTDREILKSERGIISLAVFIFLIMSAFIFLFFLKFVNRPIRRLIEGTERIARGDYQSRVDIDQDDEMGQLASAINHMGQQIWESYNKLDRQRNEYQELFEQVPCLITVQDRNFRLLRYNRQFAERFDPQPGDFCYRAYKGRTEKCVDCPVEKTFEDGLPHSGEESGIDKDGTLTHWIFTTSPLKNDRGEIVAAMEMSLDITSRKRLEEELERSEKKYHAIFNNIPNPVFVLDTDTLEILDCNERVEKVYGYTPEQLQGHRFLDLFRQGERDYYAFKMMTASVINQVKHVHRDGRTLFVTIRISLSEYSGEKVLLVTTGDITKRLEAEQQLIQASKMATLGEMATGVAHELNQPLSVIKTASSFCLKKIRRREFIDEKILIGMLEKVDSNVDRAAKIISHMRQFARKSELKLERIQLVDVMRSAHDIFSQQLRVRGIEVVWEIEENLPKINADPGRLEQVFINLLVNARDAIEEKQAAGAGGESHKRITLGVRREEGSVICRVCDTGTGIAPEIADKIFEPFFTTKEVGKGTGLGLSISYGIVRECGGQINVESTAGEGTCFVLTFPVQEKNGFPDET